MSSDGIQSALVLSASTELLLALGGLFFYFRYIRAVRRFEQLRQEKDVIFGFMHDVGEAFAGADTVSPEHLLKRVLFYAQRTCRATSGAIYLFEGEGEAEELHAKAVSGIFPPLTEPVGGSLDAAGSKSRYIEHLVRTRPIKRGEGLLGQSADLGAPALITEAEADPRIPRHEADVLRVRSAVVVPLRFQQQVLGVLALVNRVDGHAFTESDQSLLQALADQAAASVHYAGLRDVLAEKKRIDHDLAVARQIQSSLLPATLPQIPGLELAAFNEPAQQIGGDYYDVLRVDANHLGIAIADVSGKGIGGALLMSVCRSVLRAQAPGNTNPADVLRALNRVMNRDIGEDMFVTMIYMVLELDTMKLTIARAGHERAVLVTGGQIVRPEGAGAAIGMVDDDTFDLLLKETSVTLQPGDLLVTYTDGITEAQNAAGEEWGFDRFAEEVIRAAPEGAHSALSHVRAALSRHVGNRAPYDDMTLIAVRKLP